ncbi:MAG: hypothetical protein ABT940_00425 [Alphaproteobacteria bacterium]
MAEQFYKGRTNNHLTWVMVDATDFATPESALSQVTKIKIYGKLRSGTGVNFVSSGTGSLTNDIQHVGASALGIYTIALAKADLSDASAAWYDQYIISLSATGAAYQTLIADGGIDNSYLSNVVSYLSNVVSNMSGILSDCYSAVVVCQSGASDAASAAAQANSRVLVIQSMVSDVDSALTSRFSDIQSLITTTGVQLNASTLSDIRSAISAGPAATVTASDISDIASAVWAYTLANKIVTLNSSDISDLRSAISAGPAGAVTTSDISDIASAVWANTIGARVDSRVLLNLSRISDVASVLTVVQSDVSDLTSRITGAVATASDVASKVWAEKYTAASNVKASTFGSLFRLAGSRVSDIQSQITAGVSLDASTMSDIRSAISAGAAGTLTVSDISDIASRVQTVLASDLSDILSAAQQTNSRVLVTQSLASDAHSAAVATRSLASDAHSMATANSSSLSDIYSLLSDLQSKVGVTSGIISDIASAVLSAGIKKNTALSNFTFLMVSSSDHITPSTGLTVAATRSIDGGAFAACTNSGTIAEVGNGIYRINFSTTDLNGDVITVRFTATGADDRYLTIKTQP